jgi:hypothetical protein
MARMGTFAGASEVYGLPLSYIHPKDNDFAKARFHPILLDPRLKLTDKQRRSLQEKIDDLAGLGRLAREKAIQKIVTKENKGRQNRKKNQKNRDASKAQKRHKQVRNIMKNKGVSAEQARNIRRRRRARRK